MYSDDERIDLYLASLPLSPVPSGFTRRLMEAVRAEKIDAPANLAPTPRFSLGFLDFALPAFLAFFATLGFIMAAVALLIVDPFWLLKLQLELQPALWRLPEGALTFALIFSGSLLFCIMVIVGVIGVLAQRSARVVQSV